MSESKPAFGQTDVVYLRDEDASVRLLEGAIGGLWEVVNQLTRFRRSKRENFRVTISGSARIQPGSPVYDAVKQLAAELTAMGCDIVTGGGPGQMQAANEGAVSVDPEARERSVGIRVALPFEQTINPFVGQAHAHRTFLSRLHHFMIVSDAFVVVPGGIGTLLEMSLVWQLLQVRKLYATPLILVGKMWAERVEWGRRSMLQQGRELASAVDFSIPQCVSDVAETIALIRTKREEWLRAQAALAESEGDLQREIHEPR